jgi:pyruvate formate lyase activating enzyme
VSLTTTLLSLIYGAVSSLAANPIEKKPFYNFHPGTFALTVGSWSCNFDCRSVGWCMNRSAGLYSPAKNILLT